MTGAWLADPARLGLRADALPAGKPVVVPARLAERAREVPIADDGEPLVPVPLPVRRVYAELPLRALPARTLLRQGLAERLVDADAALPAPFSLVVLDGWRSLDFQRELLDYYSGRHEDLDGFVSDPGDADLAPPHVTGGAVDLTLAHDGRPLALGTDFDAFEGAAAVDRFEAPGADDLVRRLRRLLAGALTAQGLAPLAEEWWHWSYGDQRWAVCRGEPRARYGLLPG
ncbi:M15 family metallopeptidase [Geodermatophilus sp. SYSU D00815]